MAADQSVPALDVPTSLPDPFSKLSRFERLPEVLEPLAVEFWTARKPLKDAFIALEHGWNDDRAQDAALCLTVGDELRKVELVAFPSDMANAVRLDVPPTPEQIATQAMWCVLAAAAAGDDRRVHDLVEQILSRPAVHDELAVALPLVVEDCLAKWRCETSPGFTERLRTELERQNIAPAEAREWMHSGGVGFSPGARNALRSWLKAIETGQHPTLDDSAETWEPEEPETPHHQQQSNPQTDPATAPNPQPPSAPATKRSTERGEGRAKLVAALTKHHEFADSGCLNLEPVGNNELARLAGVSVATASEFFKAQFKGHLKYRALCHDAGKLAAALKLLNGEFAPHLL